MEGDSAVSPPASGTCASIGEGEQSVEEAVDPAWLAAATDGQFAGHGEGEKCSDRARSHGGQVAQSASQAAVADRLGGMPVAAKVHIFEGKVGSDGDFFAPGRAKEGAVVADAQAHSLSSSLASCSQRGDHRQIPRGGGDFLVAGDRMPSVFGSDFGIGFQCLLSAFLVISVDKFNEF